MIKRLFSEEQPPLNRSRAAQDLRRKMFSRWQTDRQADSGRLPHLKIALVLVRFDYIASRIINAKYRII